MKTTALLMTMCIGGTICSSHGVVRQSVVKQRVAVPVVKQAIVKQVVPVVPTTISYFVGAGYRQEAGLEERLDRIERLLADQLRSGGRSGGSSGQATNRPPQDASNATGVFAEACAKCHDNEAPKGGFLMNQQAGLTASEVTKAIRQVATGKMPPAGEPALSREKRNGLLTEILNMERIE